MKIKIAIALFLVFGIASQLNAATINLNWSTDSQSYHPIARLNTGINVYIGSFSGNLDGTAIPNTYCVDLGHYLNGIPTSYAVVDSMTNKPNGFNFPAGNAGRVAWLVNTYAPQVDTGIEAAALQLALWEAAYETNGSLDIGNGAFSASTDSAVILQANIWLGTVGLNTSVARFFDYQGIGHGGQDMITTASVPEPMTLILLGSGLLGIVGFRKRFRR